MNETGGYFRFTIKYHLTTYTILLVNLLKRKMDDFWLIQKRKFSNSSVINEYYFEEESKKGRFYWAN